MWNFPVVKLHQCLDDCKSKMSEYATLAELPLEQGTYDSPSPVLHMSNLLVLSDRTESRCGHSGKVFEGGELSAAEPVGAETLL